jgi:hypothetical protein
MSDSSAAVVILTHHPTLARGGPYILETIVFSGQAYRFSRTPADTSDVRLWAVASPGEVVSG